MIKKTDKRPPDGVVPRALWLQTRAEHLANAVSRYVAAGYIGGGYQELIKYWIDELSHILGLLNEINKEET